MDFMDVVAAFDRGETVEVGDHRQFVPFGKRVVVVVDSFDVTVSRVEAFEMMAESGAFERGEVCATTC